MKSNKKLVIALLAVFLVTVGILGLSQLFQINNTDHLVEQFSEDIDGYKEEIIAEHSNQAGGSFSPSQGEEGALLNNEQNIDIGKENTATELEWREDTNKEVTASNRVLEKRTEDKLVEKPRDEQLEKQQPSNARNNDSMDSLPGSEAKKEAKPTSASPEKSTKEKSQANSNGIDQPSNKSKDQKKGESNNTPQPEEEEELAKNGIQISYSIMADEHMGVVLPPTQMEIKQGSTVLEALVQVTRENKIPLSFRGGMGTFAYVAGINNLFEFDRGPGSGWMYRVNDIFPNRGAGVITLEDGDRIEWLYTIDLGHDIGAELQPFR